MLNSLFLKVDATVILLLLPFPIFFPSPSYGEYFTLYNFLFDHLDLPFVNHLNLHLSTCHIRPLLWFSVNGSGWECTVQKSFPHKCGQKSFYNALNAVIIAFLLDISTFLSFPYVSEVHPYRWKFLEGHLSYLSTCLTDIHLSEKDNLLGLYFSTFFCM